MTAAEAFAYGVALGWMLALCLVAYATPRRREQPSTSEDVERWTFVPADSHPICDCAPEGLTPHITQFTLEPPALERSAWLPIIDRHGLRTVGAELVVLEINTQPEARN